MGRRMRGEGIGAVDDTIVSELGQVELAHSVEGRCSIKASRPGQQPPHVGCIINGRHCGRVHSAIDGLMYPLLGVVGVLNVLGVVTVNWNVYWTIFFAILGASLLAELVWRKYV
jgi:hypothetical protein